MLHRHRLIVTLVAAFSCSAQAVIIHVDAANCPGPGDGSELDPYCSIQTAIDNAVDTDEIIVAPGTYFEGINFIGKAITLRSSGGAAVTIIDGTGNFHVVQCVSGEGSGTVLDGFTITGGNASGGSTDDLGGGMLNVYSSPTVIGCTFSGNAALRGGGMANFHSDPTVTDCTFDDNSANFGAGMRNSDSIPTVTRCTFSGNTALNAGGGMFNTGDFSPIITDCTFDGNTTDFGGGMYNSFDTSPTVTDCTFSGNSANVYGGGMYNVVSYPTVTTCSFTGNSAGASGGGMYNVRDSNPTVIDCTFDDNLATGNGGGMNNHDCSNPTVTNCTFSGNAANVGGGMINEILSRPTVTNCTFSGNSADIGGGMVNAVGSSPTITSCTFILNSADVTAGGMYNTGTSSPIVANCTFIVNSALIFGGGMHNKGANPTVTDCTFSGNTVFVQGGAMYNENTSSPTLTNCVSWANNPDEIFVESGAPNITFCNVEGGIPGTGNIDADPLFVNPLNGDFRLSPGSPCIDAGDNTAVPAGITTDLDGNPRFVDDPNTIDSGNGAPPVVDMGAYEFQGASPCPWDCQAVPEGTVGIVDFLALLAQWGSPGSCDFDGGGVGITDFLELLGNWGACP